MRLINDVALYNLQLLLEIYSGKHLKKEFKKAFPLWVQACLRCTASTKECLKAVIVLETRGEIEKRREKEEEEEEKGGDFRLRISFMGRLELWPFAFCFNLEYNVIRMGENRFAFI